MNKKNDKSSSQTMSEQAKRDAAMEEVLQGTEAGTIWGEIKDKNIEMFALPNQKVHMHCHPVPVEPNKLYLLTNSTAVLPSLESSINKDGNVYVVELADRFVTVARVTISPTAKYGK